MEDELTALDSHRIMIFPLFLQLNLLIEGGEAPAKNIYA
jgi:hypothetical protein